MSSSYSQGDELKDAQSSKSRILCMVFELNSVFKDLSKNNLNLDLARSLQYDKLVLMIP